MLVAASAMATTPVTSLGEKLTKSGVSAEQITPIDATGLYQVHQKNGGIVYTDANAKYLFVGQMFDIQTHENLTEAAMLASMPRFDWATLPLKDAIKIVKGNGTRKVAVFSDPDCPYCKMFENTVLSALDDVTVYTFLYPMDKAHPDASHKAKLIWCASDRAAAWSDWMQRGTVPSDDGKCATPLERNAELARAHEVSGTPTLVFTDGSRMLGARSADELVKRWASLH